MTFFNAPPSSRPASEKDILGQDLAHFSEEELAERIDRLRDEINRVIEEQEKRRGAHKAAEAFFKT